MTLDRFIYTFGIKGETHGENDTSWLAKGHPFLIEVVPSTPDNRFIEIVPWQDGDDFFYPNIPTNVGMMKFNGTKSIIRADSLIPVIMVGPNNHPVQSNWYGVSTLSE